MMMAQVGNATLHLESAQSRRRCASRASAPPMSFLLDRGGQSCWWARCITGGIRVGAKVKVGAGRPGLAVDVGIHMLLKPTDDLRGDAWNGGGVDARPDGGAARLQVELIGNLLGCHRIVVLPGAGGGDIGRINKQRVFLLELGSIA